MSGNPSIENATIEHTCLGYLDEYGYLSYTLGFGLLNSSKSFGTHDLRFFGIDLITRLLRVTGADSWESLVGTNVRVKLADRKIRDIGHLMEDEWLDLPSMMKRIRKRADRT